jgi:hypothetical protein
MNLDDNMTDNKFLKKQAQEIFIFNPDKLLNNNNYNYNNDYDLRNLPSNFFKDFDNDYEKNKSNKFNNYNSNRKISSSCEVKNYNKNIENSEINISSFINNNNNNTKKFFDNKINLEDLKYISINKKFLRKEEIKNYIDNNINNKNNIKDHIVYYEYPINFFNDKNIYTDNDNLLNKFQTSLGNFKENFNNTHIYNNNINNELINLNFKSNVNLNNINYYKINKNIDELNYNNNNNTLNNILNYNIDDQLNNLGLIDKENQEVIFPKKMKKFN